MKKWNLCSLVFIMGLSACQEAETTQENEHSENMKSIEQSDTINEAIAEVIEDVDEVKIDFNTFNDYATILSKEDLIAQFGKENLEDRTAWYAEGTVERQSTVLTDPNNGNIIKFVWSDEDNSTTSWIEASYYKWNENYEIKGKQTIKTEDGLKLGMSLMELREWNEADIKFSGFGWDYAGGIFVEEGSKLAESNVELTLINNQDKSNEGFEFMLGDVELSTTDERLTDAPVLVEMFSLYIEK